MKYSEFSSFFKRLLQLSAVAGHKSRQPPWVVGTTARQKTTADSRCMRPEPARTAAGRCPGPAPRIPDASIYAVGRVTGIRAHLDGPDSLLEAMSSCPWARRLRLTRPGSSAAGGGPAGTTCRPNAQNSTQAGASRTRFRCGRPCAGGLSRLTRAPS